MSGASHRVVTEHSRVAMPEITIACIPMSVVPGCLTAHRDAAASFSRSRVPS